MRDLRKDLEICEAATSGPWNYDLDGSLACVHTIKTDITDYSLSENDAIFIAQARTGWPESINRAMAAEAEVERLQNKHSEHQSNFEALYLKYVTMRNALQWIKQQGCANRVTKCYETDMCITEYCLPCYARTALKGGSPDALDK